MGKFDQQKAGLQDDHDPRDPAQEQNAEPGDFKPPKQPAGPSTATRTPGASEPAGT